MLCLLSPSFQSRRHCYSVSHNISQLGSQFFFVLAIYPSGGRNVSPAFGSLLFIAASAAWYGSTSTCPDIDALYLGFGGFRNTLSCCRSSSCYCCCYWDADPTIAAVILLRKKHKYSAAVTIMSFPLFPGSPWWWWYVSLLSLLPMMVLSSRRK